MNHSKFWYALYRRKHILYEILGRLVYFFKSYLIDFEQTSFCRKFNNEQE